MNDAIGGTGPGISKPTLKARLKPYITIFAAIGLMPVSAILFMVCFLVGPLNFGSNLSIGILAVIQIIALGISIHLL